MNNSLRPTKFKEYIGQKRIIETIKMIIESSKIKNQPIDHILLSGPPGLGKTSLANVISIESKKKIRYAQGPMLEKKSDILALFGSISDSEIIFIDEIHGINKNVEELIYSAMEDGVIDLVIGPEGDSKIVRLKLPKFTLIGATTRLRGVSEPLKDRFGLLSRLQHYSLEEMTKIIKISSKKLHLSLSDDAISLINEASLGVPRKANNYLKRIHDYSVAKKKEEISLRDVKKVFKILGVHKFGLVDIHISYLKMLLNDLKGKATSIETISSLLKESKQMIEIDVEPILLKHNLVTRTSRGRKITKEGEKYLENL